MAALSIELFGRTLKNPLMNASGTLGYGWEIESLWSVNTLGAYVTKGLSLTPHHGNPPPRVWEEKRGMLNSIGLQNVGLERFFADYFPLFKKRRTPVIINFFGFTDDEYVRCAERIEPDELILALEINLSCPNIKQGGICLGKEPAGVFTIVRKIKSVTSIPLIAKLTPEVTDIVEVARAAYEAGADGLTIINTFPAAAIDVTRGMRPFRGGLSGPALKPIALKDVAEITKAVPIPVIGAGGIMDLRDALAFIAAGARAIQVGTATFVDPFTIPKIIEDLQGYMAKHDIPRIDLLVGASRA